MTQAHKPLIFIDSNVLIEGLLENFAAAKTIITLASYKKLDLITCKQVIVDVEDELIEQAKAYNEFSVILDSWQKMCQKIRIKILPDPPLADVLITKQNYLPLMHHLADIPILTAAITATPRPTVILSGNRKHFNNRVAHKCGIPIHSCSEYIQSHLHVL